mmetsp:Transcript_16408/g.26705  ORF Transcript_16408/g.26705 Transcript_16408/m.26705 type:complete len:97 (+) Transcript_16408:335-625(+)
MAKQLGELVDKKISVITNDGRQYVGILKGLDQTTNVVLSDCVEHIYSETKGCQVASRGLFLIRGDNTAIIGQVDPDLESKIDLDSVRAAPLKPIVH